MATPYFFYLSSVVPQRPVASNWLFRVVSTLLSPSSKFIDISTPARIERASMRARALHGFTDPSSQSFFI